jgi:hypothetical protein
MSIQSAAKSPAAKLRSMCLCVHLKVSPDAVGAFVAAAIPKMMLRILYVRSIPTEEGSCLVTFHTDKAVYQRQWESSIVSAFGAGYLNEVTREAQEAYRDGSMQTVKTRGAEIYKSPSIAAKESAPRPEPDAPRVRLAFPAIDRSVARMSAVKRTRVATDGVVGEKLLRQTRLCIVDVGDPPAGSVVAPGSEPPPAGAAPVLRPPFEQGDFAKGIREFLQCETPWVAAVEPPEPRASEAVSDTVRRLRRKVNLPPKGMRCVELLVPGAVRNRYKYPELTGLTGGSVCKLGQWFRAGGWEGVMALCPFADQQEVSYGYPGGVGCSVLELHRRALGLERALGSLSMYMLGVVRAAPSLNLIPAPAQHAARLLSEYGVGMNGEGRGFWTRPTPEQASILARLAEGRAGKTEEIRGLLEYLRSARAEAFTPRYHVGAQLCWVLPTVAFLFEHRGLLGALGDEEQAGRLLAAVNQEWLERGETYSRCREPLVKYGAHLCRSVPVVLRARALTDPSFARRLLSRLRDLCNTFRELPSGGGAVFPDDVRPVEVSPAGKMINPATKQPLSFGVFEAQQRQPLLPFPDKCCDLEPLPPQALFDLARARHFKEHGCIASMFAALGVDLAVGASPALYGMMQANAVLNRIFHDDSHALRLTAALPPTASMRSAVYAPEALYVRGPDPAPVCARGDEWSYAWPFDQAAGAQAPAL